MLPVRRRGPLARSSVEDHIIPQVLGAAAQKSGDHEAWCVEGVELVKASTQLEQPLLRVDAIDLQDSIRVGLGAGQCEGSC